MKQHTFLFGFLVLLCGAVFFPGCPTGPEEDGGKPFTEVKAGETKYYSLSTGEEVTGEAINTTAWDIAFEKKTLIAAGPLIHTNSGAAAESSGGQGGVWYTDKKDLASVALNDKIEANGEYAGLNVDTEKWIQVPPAVTPPLFSINMNVMTYSGYVGDGDGSEIKPYQANPSWTGPQNYIPYTYDKKQFYSIKTGVAVTASYTLENWVYIIRHGDGSKYSKIQITGFEMPSGQGKDVYQIKYQNF
jgi:hypothetical protein